MKPVIRLRALLPLAMAWAGSASAANLGDLLTLARENDAQYAAAREAAAAGAEKAVQGRAGLLPTVGLTGNLRTNEERSNSYSGTRDYSSSGATLQASQPLYRPANWAAARQGELQSDLAAQQLRIAEQELLLRVSKGYFEVLQAQDAMQTLRMQKDSFSQQLEQATKSLEVGVVPITDVNEAKSRYDLTVAQEVAAMNDLEVKRRMLEKSIDTALPPLATLGSEAGIDLLPADQVRQWVDRAPDDSLQVTAATLSRDIAEREVALREAGHQPTLDLVASLGDNRNANFATQGRNNLRQASIGLELSIPLYQGGAVSSRAREAAANLRRAERELDEARRQARLDARQALLGVQSGLALTRALTQAERSGQTQLLSTRRGLEVGLRNRVDVLNAEQQLYATRRDLSAARYQTLISGLQLKAAAGVLNDTDLRALDALLTTP